jgi:putative ATP-dependent endonuclease of OLD family
MTIAYAEVTNRMARLSSLSITNYRSIGPRLEIQFPDRAPLILLGENNAGKSNIIGALQLLLGPFWPSHHEPDDNDFHRRETGRSIEIMGRFDDADLFGHRYESVTWRYSPNDEDPIFYKGAPGPYDHPYGFISGPDRDSCTCIVIEAERNLKYQLSYSSKWTFLSRLMHRFHGALRDQPDIREELERAFSQIKTSFRRLPEFQQFSQNLQDHFTQLVGSMTHRLDIDFEAYNPANFFHALDLHASEGGQPRTIAEMGTGEQQILAMAFAHAFARAFHGGIILVIEEPEAHLHPLAQQWLAEQLEDMCSDGLQILITTHSPAFVNVMNLNGIVVVRKEVGASVAVQKTVDDLVAHCVATGAPAARTTAETILPFYTSNATRTILEGFFAKAVVLVEGPTESLSLPIYLAKVGFETARDGVSIIGVQGKGNLAKWRRLFTCYGIPCYIIFDNDPDDDGPGSKRRDALSAVGIHGNDAEAFIGTDDWLIEAATAVFGTDFETSLRAAFPSYTQLETQAAEEGVDSKPFKARYVAENLEVNASAGWERIRQLAARIRALLPAALPNDEPELQLPDDDIPF